MQIKEFPIPWLIVFKSPLEMLRRQNKGSNENFVYLVFILKVSGSRIQTFYIEKYSHMDTI